MNNLFSYCGLVDAKIRASDKHLHVSTYLSKILSYWTKHSNLVKEGTKSNFKASTIYVKVKLGIIYSSCDKNATLKASAFCTLLLTYTVSILGVKILGERSILNKLTGHPQVESTKGPFLYYVRI